MAFFDALRAGFQMIVAPLNAAVSFVLDPLLALPPIAAIALIAAVASVLVALASKYLTNQTLMKALKEEIDSLQKQLKELRDKPEHAMEVQRRFTEVNLKYMSQSLRTSFFTLIPLLLIVTWLNAHYAFYPLAPGNDFTIDVLMKEGASGNVSVKDIVPDGLEVLGPSTATIVDTKAQFGFRGDAPGTYLVTFEHNGTAIDRPVKISDEYTYAAQVVPGDGTIESTRINYAKRIVIPLGFWNWLGALGTYIIFSIAFSIGLRKFFKIY